MDYPQIKSSSRLTPQFWMSRHLAAIVLGALLGMGTIGLTSCTQLAKVGVGTTPMEKIVSNPTKYTEVTIRGKVVNRVGILGKGAYELKDDSGSLWVLTSGNEMPAVGSTVTVKGTVSQGVSLGDKNLAVTLTEQQRL